MSGSAIQLVLGYVLILRSYIVCREIATSMDPYPVHSLYGSACLLSVWSLGRATGDGEADEGAHPQVPAEGAAAEAERGEEQEGGQEVPYG